MIKKKFVTKPVIFLNNLVNDYDLNQEVQVQVNISVNNKIINKEFFLLCFFFLLKIDQYVR